MDWTQTITLGGTLIAYMTGISIFLFRLTEKNIKEWRMEHSEQITRNEIHWREMFMYMSGRIDDEKHTKSNRDKVRPQ
ncbi:hypothetical protein [Candidatus Finniella inopinata]|uniref:Uncharacterized protein n=1 Tax=Candidatus Finniella inopinata TaxID=1696036 RepID=A0A4Q7DKB4_9PROT|nr:hypothetical protein [Candidatus Finniella inopinata]RZI45106.1 hypothetical protein EQU50_08195 [Candidatus Finniella inopinata]